jgi:hypothetical protein
MDPLGRHEIGQVFPPTLADRGLRDAAQRSSSLISTISKS